MNRQFNLILLVILLLAAINLNAQNQQAASWQAVITDKNEPGQALIVTGIVYREDGKTPLADALVYVYHTDNAGYYNQGGRDSSNPRLRAWLKTNAQGQYEYRTIKPGPYPDTRGPAHIHYEVTAAGYQKKIFEIVFADDPRVDREIRNRAKDENSGYSIRPLTKDTNGVLHCVQDIKLKRD